MCGRPAGDPPRTVAVHAAPRCTRHRGTCGAHHNGRMMKRTYATIGDLLATYSSHVSSNYPSPAQFCENLDRILDGKRERFQGDGYIAALEKNVVFLHDLIVEGEAALDMLFDTKTSRSLNSSRVNSLLGEMEERVRERSEQRRNEAFIERGGDEFAVLRELRRTDAVAYLDKLESTYRSLMIFKVLLFEFFNVMGPVMSRYPMARTTEETRRQILNHIELTANYYLGTIAVKDDDET